MPDNTTKILISACLLGERVRYDGVVLIQDNELIKQWNLEGRLVSFCPEVAGGLSTPRAAAEIVGGSGAEVLKNEALIINNKHEDVTLFFLKGAHKALVLCQKYAIKHAILTERSPSCGGQTIYDGSFNHILRDGEGVTAALLRQHGIVVFSQHDLLKLNPLMV